MVASALTAAALFLGCTTTEIPPYGGLPGDFVDGSSFGEGGGDDGTADDGPGEANETGSPDAVDGSDSAVDAPDGAGEDGPDSATE